MASLEIQHHYRPSTETDGELDKNVRLLIQIFSLRRSIHNYMSSKWPEVESHSEHDNTVVWKCKVQIKCTNGDMRGAEHFPHNAGAYRT